MSVRTWLQAARPLAHVNLAIPLLLGEVLAWHATGRIEWTFVVLAHVFAVFDQLFIVFANDVADEAADRLHDAPTPFSGGSRVLPEGKLTAAQLRRAAAGAGFLVLGTCGVAAWMGRPGALVAGATAIALLIAYSFPPARLSYRGFGEIAQGVGTGVVLPLFAYYLQTGELATFPWAVLAPSALLGAASNIVTALPDEKADTAAHKATWPVQYGQSRARKHALQAIALAALLTPLVLPHATQTQWLLVELGPGLLLLAAAVGPARADPADRRALLRFVLLAAAAIQVVLLGWIVALVADTHFVSGAIVHDAALRS